MNDTNKIRCIICGEEFSKSPYANIRVCKNRRCFTEWFWTDTLDEDAIIVNQNCYHIGNEDAAFKGFDGKRFKFRMYDGRVIESTNVWHNGKIPDEYYGSDNAIQLF